MPIDSQMFYVMLAMPTLFGLTLLTEGVYKTCRYESGWFSILLGSIFLMMVAFGYFYLKGYVR